MTMLEAEEKITTDQIWGTTIKVEEVRKSFKKFLKEFKLSDLSHRNGRSDDDPFYIEYLKIVSFKFFCIMYIFKLIYDFNFIY